MIRAGHILMVVETPCTDGVCPYCKSSTGGKDKRMEEIWTCPASALLPSTHLQPAVEKSPRSHGTDLVPPIMTVLRKRRQYAVASATFEAEIPGVKDLRRRVEDDRNAYSPPPPQSASRRLSRRGPKPVRKKRPVRIGLLRTS